MKFNYTKQKGYSEIIKAPGRFLALIMGGLIRRIMNGRGHFHEGQAGCGGLSRPDATGLAFPYGLCSFCSPPVATNQ